MDIRHLVTGIFVAALAGLTAQAPIADAAPSPPRRTAHQGLIVFGADETGSYQLYTVRPDGSRLHQVTHIGEGDAQAPDWSPDGRRIVFELVLRDSGKIGIINADGSGLRWLSITAGMSDSPPSPPMAGESSSSGSTASATMPCSPPAWTAATNGASPTRLTATGTASPTRRRTGSGCRSSVSAPRTCRQLSSP